MVVGDSTSGLAGAGDRSLAVGSLDWGIGRVVGILDCSSPGLQEEVAWDIVDKGLSLGRQGVGRPRYEIGMCE